MNLFEEERFDLYLQHLGHNSNGLCTFTDESDQHFDTVARQLRIEETGDSCEVELLHFDNSISTYNAQMIEHESANEDGDYECVLIYDTETEAYVLQRLISQIQLNPSRATGQTQDKFDDELSRDMDEILNSQDEDEDEDEEGHDVFEEILTTNTQYSPYIAPTPRYSPVSPRYQLSSETNQYTPEFNLRSPTPLEGSDHSEIVGYEPRYRETQESSESESESEEENDDDDDLDSLANDISMTLTTGVASAPDSPRPDYIIENNANYHSPVTVQHNNAGPMSLRALFNDDEEEEEEESQSNSDSD